jgi:hypothetical protein
MLHVLCYMSKGGEIDENKFEKNIGEWNFSVGCSDGRAGRHD